MSTRLPDALVGWLAGQAGSLDLAASHAEDVLPALAAAGLFSAGVPSAWGGQGGDVRDGVQAIAAVAEHSLAAAFVFWGQRAFIEYVLQSPRADVRERWLADLVAGRRAGASGLSNAMKYLSGIESLQIRTTEVPGQPWRLEGALAWVTNLRKAGFLAAAAVERDHGSPPAIVVIDSGAAGVTRSEDLDLLALRGSNTAAVKVAGLELDASMVIAEHAPSFLPSVRPAFLGLQCGMSIGLARASLKAAQAHCTGSHQMLHAEVRALGEELDAVVAELHEGLADERFKTQAAPLFRLRIRLADLVQRAVSHELMACGGGAYLQDRNADFARRWRESAFIPIVTPSLTQLQGELMKQSAASHSPAPTAHGLAA